MLITAGDRPSAQVTLWLGYSPNPGPNKLQGVHLYHNNSYVSTISIDSYLSASEGTAAAAVRAVGDGPGPANLQQQQQQQESALVGVALLEERSADPESVFDRCVIPSMG